MADITAALVKELRETTGAGMMDCKKALTETSGEMEAAIDWLRTAGLAAAAKKSSRVASEGLIAVSVSGNRGACVEVNSETDFVARNDQFQKFVADTALLALDNNGHISTIMDAVMPEGGSVAEKLQALVATIGENMNLRRAVTLEVENGVVASYVHNSIAPGLGKIGVLVGLESEGDAEKLSALGRQIAMHVAAVAPRWTSIDEIDPDVLERERNVLAEQARASGKPEEIVAKMVEGRLRKFYEESVLVEQVYVIDGESKVSKVVEQAANDIGSPITVTGFVRFVLGEGVEKEEADFAAEVAAVAKG
jgi:elongation factor Ts